SAQPFGGKPKLMMRISERNGSAMLNSSFSARSYYGQPVPVPVNPPPVGTVFEDSKDAPPFLPDRNVCTAVLSLFAPAYPGKFTVVLWRWRTRMSVPPLAPEPVTLFANAPAPPMFVQTEYVSPGTVP